MEALKQEEPKEGGVSAVKVDLTILPPKPVGLDINRKKVKKLIIKPKKPKKETQTNFDNVFKSRLKLENTEEDVDDIGLGKLCI